jgi:uncharacterized protein
MTAGIVPCVEAVRFATEDGVSLEGELRVDVEEPRGSAVICHPHPRHGGSKDHPLLWAVRNELAHRGFAVLAFNFRGNMGSGGTYGGGRDEVRDVRAAVGRARQAASAFTFVCGWSFGANVAIREALDDERVGGLALIGLPLRTDDVPMPALPGPFELRLLKRPVTFLAGEADTYCPPAALRAYAHALPAAEVVVLEGTDHFFWRREKEAATIVGDAAERALSS